MTQEVDAHQAAKPVADEILDGNGHQVSKAHDEVDRKQDDDLISQLFLQFAFGAEWH